MQKHKWFALALIGAVVSSCAPDGESAIDIVTPEDIAALEADLAARGVRPFMRPRAIMLEVPWEHMAASGGVDSIAHSPRYDDLVFAGPGQPPLKVFLNRNGGTYSPGQDDSRTNRSIVPRSTSQIPAWTFGDTKWEQLKACVTDQFARFNVQIVDVEPPSNERYVEHVVGGRPQNVGLPNGVGGVAPIDNFNCRVIDIAINYTFSEVYGGNVQSICETAAQEIAHSFSLDHELHCPDPMTYLGGCGAKTFKDLNAQCGEYQPRACNCNRAAQNSVQIMIEKLGAAGSGSTQPTPPTETVPPQVAINSPADGATLTADSTITITATATDNAAIAATDLIWDQTGDVFPCPTNFGGGAVTCTRTGNVSTWNVRVGQGSRRFSVRARDTSGNTAETSKRTISLGTGGGGTPGDTTPPTASITSPNDSAVLPANTTMQVVATANDNSGQLASIDLLWNFTGDTFPCPFSGQAVSCVQNGTTFTWTLNVGVGLRAFQVRAIDTAGNTTITGERTVELSSDGAVNPGDPDTVGEPNNTPADAFGIRCGNALDLVVSQGDDDWFAIDAPAETAIQVGIATNASTAIGLELTSADGQVVLASVPNIVTAGGELRAVSPGPAVLARVFTTGGAASYRLTATCSQEGGDVPEPDTDDDLEDNDTPATPTRAFCGQERPQLIAADPDYYVVGVRDGDVLRVALTGLGVQATIVDGEGTSLSSTGKDVRTTQGLPVGDFLIKVEPEDAASPAFYDIAISCSPGSLNINPIGGCGCDESGDGQGIALAGGLIGLGLLRRRTQRRERA